MKEREIYRVSVSPDIARASRHYGFAMEGTLVTGNGIKIVHGDGLITVTRGDSEWVFPDSNCSWQWLKRGPGRPRKAS
jgi:hypothetical protein